MSTRAQIRIVTHGLSINFYAHGDGGFDWTGKNLQAKLKEFFKKKKERYHGDETIPLEQLLCELQNVHELTIMNHWDTQYFYLMDFDKREFKALRTKGTDAWQGCDTSQPWYEWVPVNVREEKNLLRSKMDD